MRFDSENSSGTVFPILQSGDSEILYLKNSEDSVMEIPEILNLVYKMNPIEL